METSIFKIAEQAQRILAGGTPTDDFEPRIQELIISADQFLADQILNQHISIKGIDGENFIPGEYICAFEGMYTISHDACMYISDTLNSDILIVTMHVYYTHIMIHVQNTCMCMHTLHKCSYVYIQREKERKTETKKERTPKKEATYEQQRANELNK